MTIAVMKKSRERMFQVTKFDGEKVTLHELGNLDTDTKVGAEKSIAIKTFNRSYEITEGQLEFVTVGGVTEDTLEAAGDIESPNNSIEATEDKGDTTEESKDIIIDSLPDSFLSESERETLNKINLAAVMGGTVIESIGGTLVRDSFSSNKSVLDPTRKPEEWEAPKTAPSGWDLVPVYANPTIGEPQKPLLEQTDVHSANSMRANRETAAIPFKPNPFFLRQSMISSYLQCPDKFYDTYENGYSEDTIFTKTGTAIHGVMEDYYKDPQNANIDDLFEQWWRSHSTPEWDWYRDWKVMVNDYFAKQKDKPHPQIIALEFEFQTEVNGIPVSGTIDRIDRIDSKTIRIIDYKTNFMPFSETDLQESTQFRMYSVVLHKLKHIIGEFDTVECQYNMLRLGYTQEVTYTDDDLAEYEKWMAMIWGKMLDGADRKPQLNQYCSFCQKRATCDVYLGQLEAPISQILTENTDLDVITVERDRLAMVKKMVDNRIKEIDGAIKTTISENKGEIVIGNYIWSANSSTRSAYPTKSVIRILAMHDLIDRLPDMANIGTTNMRAVLKDHPEVLEEITKSAVVSYTAPSISKRKVKPVKETKK